MFDTNVFPLSQPGTFADPLTEVLRNGARALLAQAVEAEVAALLMEQARSLGQTLRLVLGRRHPRAGLPRGRGAVPAGHHRRHAGRQERTRRPHRWRARERAIDGRTVIAWITCFTLATNERYCSAAKSILAPQHGQARCSP